MEIQKHEGEQQPVEVTSELKQGLGLENVYVVYGSTGEYSDHREWFVRAFADEMKGRDFVERVSARFRELAIQYGDDRWDAPEGCNELDPHMEWDYTGTNYYLVEVPFEW